MRFFGIGGRKEAPLIPPLPVVRETKEAQLLISQICYLAGDGVNWSSRDSLIREMNDQYRGRGLNGDTIEGMVNLIMLVRGDPNALAQNEDAIEAFKTVAAQIPPANS